LCITIVIPAKAGIQSRGEAFAYKQAEFVIHQKQMLRPYNIRNAQLNIEIGINTRDLAFTLKILLIKQRYPCYTSC